MLERKIYQELLKFKNDSKKECLLIKGGRQTGKTFIVREFGKNEYQNFIEINFYTNPEYKKIFDGVLQANDIYEKISLYVNDVRFEKGKTLIFLDEIQHCPNARTSLKFLAEDKSYDVIATGSLLGLNYRDIVSIPVGYEKTIDMYSLDFEEFLWALGYKEAIAILKKHFNEKSVIDESVNNKYLDLLRVYLAVGGMPAVVNDFIENRNYQSVNSIQNAILNDYKDDINKYASTYERQRISKCFDSIPIQLAKEYTKFQYSKIEKGASSTKYESAIQWLIDAGIVSKAINISTIEIPLKAYEKQDEFKIYMNDTGLLTAMYGFTTQSLIVKNKLIGTAKGGIYENVVAAALLRNRYALNYYKKENSSQEIEFIIEKDESIVPIEIKSSNNATTSLNSILKKDAIKYGYKLINGNLGVVEKKITIPQYMAMFI